MTGYFTFLHCLQKNVLLFSFLLFLSLALRQLSRKWVHSYCQGERQMTRYSAYLQHSKKLIFPFPSLVTCSRLLSSAHCSPRRRVSGLEFLLRRRRRRRPPRRCCRRRCVGTRRRCRSKSASSSSRRSRWWGSSRSWRPGFDSRHFPLLPRPAHRSSNRSFCLLQLLEKFLFIAIARSEKNERIVCSPTGFSIGMGDAWTEANLAWHTTTYWGV